MDILPWQWYIFNMKKSTEALITFLLMLPTGFVSALLLPEFDYLITAAIVGFCLATIMALFVYFYKVSPKDIELMENLLKEQEEKNKLAKKE